MAYREYNISFLETLYFVFQMARLNSHKLVCSNKFYSFW